MVIWLLAFLLFTAPLWAGTQLDATEHYVCDSDTDIDDMTALTIAAWAVRTDDSNNHTIGAKGNFSSGGWEWSFRPAASECQQLVVDGDSGNLNHTSVTGNCVLNELHHYVVTWNGILGGSASVAFYYDGTAQSKGSSANGSGSMVTDASNSLHIAANHAGANDYGGKFACVAVWESQLSAEEVKTLAAGGCRAALRTGTNLRRLYEIHGDSVSTLYDITGNQTCSETGTAAVTELGVPFK
jgi:hypothetical protein